MLSDEEIVLKRLKETLDVLKGKNVITRLDFQIRDMVEDCIRVIEEQQKNNENWKKYCDEQENDITLKNNKICDLEFKIEKQSKEIEELKEDNKHQWEERCKLTFELENSTSNDKIKAKIEEVEQWELHNMKIPKLSTLDERLGAKIGIKYVLQSLLEKE